MDGSKATRTTCRIRRIATPQPVLSIKYLPSPISIKHPLMAITARGCGRQPYARGHPPLIRPELNAQLFVRDRKIAVRTALDCFRHDGLDFLRHYPHISFVAANVAEAIEAKSVVEVTEQGNIVLEPDIGSSPAAAESATAAAKSAAGEASTAAAKTGTTKTGTAPQAAYATALQVAGSPGRPIGQPTTATVRPVCK